MYTKISLRTRMVITFNQIFKLPLKGSYTIYPLIFITKLKYVTVRATEY